MLTEQNAAVANNKQIEDAAVVLDKLPHYFKKVQDIRAAMSEITASVDKMKRRAEGLRIDAQSRTFGVALFRRKHCADTKYLYPLAVTADALRKENKRDAQSQWNKLYAAKSTASTDS